MPLLILFAAIVVAVWWLYLAPRWSLLVLCGSYLIVASTFGYDILHFDVAGVTLTVDRLFLFLVVGVYCWQWAGGRTVRRDVPGSEVLLLGFLGLLLVNTFAHDWRRSGPDQVPVLPHLVDGYLIPVLLYWIARRAAVERRSVTALHAMFAVFGVYLAVTALCEAFGCWSLVFPRQISNPDVGTHFGRARGPFLQSVRLGIYLLVCLIATWVPLTWHRRWGRPGQLLAVGLLPLYAVAILTTYTRSVWLGLAVVAVAAALLTCEGYLRRVAIVGTVAAGLLMGGLVVQGSLVSMKREYGPAETAQSAQMRVVFAYVSWLMVQDKPIQGFGFGHFPHEKRAYLNDRSTGLQLDSIRGYIHHNTFLSILVELGAVGFLVIVGLLLAWGRLAYRLWHDLSAPDWMRGQALVFLLLLVAYVIQMAFHEVSYSPMENGLLFMMAGLTSGLGSTHWAARSPVSALRTPSTIGTSLASWS